MTWKFHIDSWFKDLPGYSLRVTGDWWAVRVPDGPHRLKVVAFGRADSLAARKSAAERKGLAWSRRAC